MVSVRGLSSKRRVGDRKIKAKSKTKTKPRIAGKVHGVNLGEVASQRPASPHLDPSDGLHRVRLGRQGRVAAGAPLFLGEGEEINKKK